MCNTVLLISNANLKFLWTILSFMDNFTTANGIFIYPENNLRMLKIFNNIWRFSTHKYKYILQSLNFIKLKVLKKLIS